jgi:predicted HTH transcriptional regulator
MKMMKRPEVAPFDIAKVNALKKLVAQGESATLEFKRKASYPEKIIAEMVAFANTQGGTLLVGVSDEGHLSGLKFPDEEAFAIRAALKKYCRPGIPYKEQLIPLTENKFILSYEIFPSNRKPHYVVHGPAKRECFVRVADKSIKASREIEEIIRRRQHKSGVKFTYGDHERMLVQYLSVHAHITLPMVMELTHLKRYDASRKLVLLVLANVLKVSPHEKGDEYSLAFEN